MGLETVATTWHGVFMGAVVVLDPFGEEFESTLCIEHGAVRFESSTRCNCLKDVTGCRKRSLQAAVVPSPSRLKEAMKLLQLEFLACVHIGYTPVNQHGTCTGAI